MTQEDYRHPIAPPPELVQQWCDPRVTGSVHFSRDDLAARAAQYGADLELEACCEWLDDYLLAPKSGQLRASRRKPPSLKEQALVALNEIEDKMLGPTVQEKLIRRALEQLSDNE